MGMILAPIAADKLPIWTSFIDEVGGARKAEFDDFNRRHKLTRHEAWLCETPGGTMVCAIHEGPGADEMMPNVSKSTHSFDQWFAAKLHEIHGLDVSKGPPPGKPPVKKLGWTA